MGGLQGLPAGSGLVVIDVADRGPGIPDGEKALIFERFHQIKGGTRLSAGGVGLGLAICRDIVASHGGALWPERAGRRQPVLLGIAAANRPWRVHEAFPGSTTLRAISGLAAILSLAFAVACSPAFQRADALFQAGDLGKAAPAYEEALAKGSTGAASARSLYRLGAGQGHARKRRLRSGQGPPGLRPPGQDLSRQRLRGARVADPGATGAARRGGCPPPGPRQGVGPSQGTPGGHRE